MMPPMFGQPWRQAMRAPQEMPQPSGNMFPVRGPGGGWMMPGGPAPFQPKPLEQPKPAPMMVPADGPGSPGWAFYNGQWNAPPVAAAGLGGLPGFGVGIGASGMDSGYGFGIGSAGGFGDASGWGV